jgi:hypothetical protein
MSSDSPVSELFSSDGYELAIINNTATPVGTRGLLVAGSDGTDSRIILMDGSNRQIVAGAGTAGTPAGGVLTIQGITSGTPVIVSQATAANLNATVTANGNFNNASVGATAAAPPADATYMGALATTAVESGLTSGDMYPFNLTTTGLLRVDGSNVTQPMTIADVTATGALGALNAAVQITTAGLETAGFQLAAGTLIGTILPEVSIDGGTTWNATYFDIPAGSKVATIVFASANIATFATIVGVGGSGLSRVRVSAYTSGTANITVRATTRTDPSVLFSNPPGSTTVPPDMAYVGGSVTTAAPTYTTGTINALSITTGGALRTLTAITDGANDGPVAVKPASTAAVATDPALVVSLSPNSHVKSTIEPLYGTNNQAVTITLTSLASAAARASTAVSNTTTLYEDVLLFFTINTGTGVSATGYVNVYGYGSVNGGTTYPEGITGTDAGVTLTSPPNLVLIAQINAGTPSVTKTFGPISFCRMYGLDKLPAEWGVVVVNLTGAAFSATNGSIIYQGINGQLV